MDIIPRDVYKYMDVVKFTGKKLLPHSRDIFIPVSHVLEYREYWEDIDNDKIGLEPCDEFDGVMISSLKGVKGERAYYKTLKKEKDEKCIDYVQTYNEREDDPMTINLTYTEKYMSGRALRNQNEFLINKSKSLVDWDYLNKQYQF